MLEIDYNVLVSQLDDEAADFVDAMLASRSSVIAVSEQFGWTVSCCGLGPPLRDAMGRMVQRLAKQADNASLVVAGGGHLFTGRIGQPIDCEPVD